jgi:hypothetical protein
VNEPGHSGDPDRDRENRETDRGDEPSPWKVERELATPAWLERADALPQGRRGDRPRGSKLRGELVEAVVHQLKRRHRR